MNWQKLKPKNPILFTLVAIFLIVNIVDSITAFFILPGEANPLFLIIGSIWPVILLKIVIIGGLIAFYVRNRYPSELMYYLIILILMLGIPAVGIATYGNIIGMQNPEALEAASKLSSEVKTKAYFTFMAIIYYIPLVFSVFTFVLYNVSKKNVIIDTKYFKKKPWWKRWRKKKNANHRL